MRTFVASLFVALASLCVAAPAPTEDPPQFAFRVVSSEQLRTDATTKAREKLLSQAETELSLRSVPDGGQLRVGIVSLDRKNARADAYEFIFTDGSGAVVLRHRGKSSEVHAVREWQLPAYKGFESINLPQWSGQLGLRVHNEALGTVGDFIVRASGTVTEIRARKDWPFPPTRAPSPSR